MVSNFGTMHEYAIGRDGNVCLLRKNRRQESDTSVSEIH